MIRTSRNKTTGQNAAVAPPPAPSAAPSPKAGDERWFAHLLRDNLCQELAGISLACELVEGRLAGIAPAEARVVQDICQAALRAMAHARQIAGKLDPVGNRPEGLTHALHALARAVDNETGATCRFICDGMAFLHDSLVATTLYRVVE